jgi:hypothetical protein
MKDTRVPTSDGGLVLKFSSHINIPFYASYVLENAKLLITTRTTTYKLQVGSLEITTYYCSSGHFPPFG